MSASVFYDIHVWQMLGGKSLFDLIKEHNWSKRHLNRQLELARALLRCHIVHFVLVYFVKILKGKSNVNVYCWQHHGNPRLPTSVPLAIILVVCTITILCARAVNSVMLVCWLLICLPAPHWTFTWNCSGHQERRCWFLWRTQFQRAKSYRRQSGQNCSFVLSLQ